ncbi:MAG: hypothetical protein AB7O48_18875 [Cyclobacteriaceae bacterium]
MRKVIFTLTSIFVLLTQFVLRAQDLSGDGNQQQITFTKWFEDQTNHALSRIYSGDSYPQQAASRFGHQFFESRQWRNGNVCLGDQWYYDLPLLFDLQNEIVVTRQTGIGIGSGIIIENQLISYFKIEDTSFIPLQHDGKKHFFEVILEGEKIDLLARHQKLQRLKSDGYHFEESVKYFLLANSELIPLANKKSLQQLTPEAKSIASEIKTREAKFNLRKRDLLVEFVRRFDERLR